ncbi:MAG: ABC transporter substrate-binding protein [Alphaproteobacteria bacterium]|nr:ABC transporter substrate-binding protein [Alphaproteobacteria bacterium]
MQSLVLVAALLLLPGGAQAIEYREAPMLQAEVAKGALPPVAKRLPERPLVVTPAERGEYGGDLNTLISGAKDTRLLMVYGYARLVGYDRDFTIKPDILEAVDVAGDRVFTLRLRKGHRFSDGHPFTSEDFRFFWEDVANNKRLSPAGPTKELLVDGKPPKVEFPDATTVIYRWDAPNPFFLPALASAAPLLIYRPAHYLKQFHEKYTTKEALEKLVKERQARNWAALFNDVSRAYRFDNPDLPELQPWRIVTRPPSDRFVAVRNAYFHRVDDEGRQLPYIDRVLLHEADGKIVPAKTGAGEVDLQARGLFFNNYTFLKAGEKRHNYQVRLWRTVRGAHLALYPNLNTNDPAWRALLRDVRFRRAISLAVDRHEINQVIYYGLALEGQNSVLPQSPLYREEYQKAHARLDLREANRLLDEIGLTRRDGRGVRLLPDGRPLDLIVETAGEDTEQTDVLELVHDTWLKVGIKLFTKPSQREVFRNRIFSGETMMSIWFGYENGVPTPDFSPEEFAPTTQQGYHWPKWGQYFETGGASGEPIDLAEAKALMEANLAWRRAGSRAEREAIWHRILAIHRDQVFTIGLIGGVLQPVVVTNRLKNVPSEAIFNWDPGAQFGIYRPDTFWLQGAPGRVSRAN